MGGKTRQTQTTNQSGTSTTSGDPFAVSGSQTNMTNWSNASPYTADRTKAGLDSNYATAGSNYGQAGQGWQSQYGNSNAAATDAYNTNRVSGPDYSAAAINQFKSPYDTDVRDATMAQMEQADAVSQNKLLQKAGGAFGNSRLGVLQSELEGQNQRNRASTLAGLNQAGFDRAVGQYNTNFDQSLRAKGQDFSQGLSYANQQQGLGDQNTKNYLSTGQAYQGLANDLQKKAESDAAIDRQATKDEYAAQEDRYQNQARAYSYMPGTTSTSSTGSGTSTTSQNNNWLGTALYGLGTAAALMSDRDLKRDVKDAAGEKVLGAFAEMPSKTYRYKDEVEGLPKQMLPEGERTGFMAQDYETSFGEPSGPDVAGHKTVDLAQLMGKLTVAVQALEERTRGLKPKGKAA